MADLTAPGLGRRLRLFRDRSHGSTIRSVLIFGFGTIFALWLLSAYDLVQRVTDAERQAAAIAERFTRREELLFNVRAQVVLSSVYARDAVLDAAPGAGPLYGEQLRAVRSEVERALQQYVPDVDSAAEREHWTRLQAELQDYWHSLSPILEGRTPGDAADTYAFIRREVIPRRELVIHISDELRTLIQDVVQQEQQAVAAIHRVLRRRIWWTSGTAVALGLGAAWLVALYAGRLESRIRQQHEQEQHARRELRRLSSELVNAHEHERRTIARDLHDEIGQALMALRLDLGVVERSGQISGVAAGALAEARSTADLAIRTVRDLSQLLHPPMLDDFGVAVTLEAYLRRFTDRTGVQTELVVDRMEGRLPSEVELCAYRVVQEALTNVARHANARSCRVYLQRLPHSMVVTIEDDGRGMDVAHLERVGGGVGLLGVRERASRLGGTVRLDTNPGKGTRLTIELPVADYPPGPPPDGARASAAIVPESV